jgi:hypothetical protein
MGSLFLKVKRFVDEVIRFGHLDHRGQKSAFTVLAKQLTLVSCERNGRVAAAQVFVPDHAGEIKSDLLTVPCPGFSKSLFKETIILRSHSVCSQRGEFLALTEALLDKYPRVVRGQRKGSERPWPENIEQ